MTTSTNNCSNGGGFTFDFSVPAEEAQGSSSNNEKGTLEESGGADKGSQAAAPQHATGNNEVVSDSTLSIGTKQQPAERCRPVRSFAWLDSNLLQEILMQQSKLYQSGKLIHDEIPLPVPAAAVPAAAVPAATAAASETCTLSSLRCIRGSSLLRDDTDSHDCNPIMNAGHQKKRQQQQHQQQQETDLIAGVYEGGLTVWECSLDLVRFLHHHHVNADSSTALSVLELGCGHGLPTCYLLRRYFHCENSPHRHHHHHHRVVLSDYNDYVLKDVTLANLFLNFIPQMADETRKQNDKDRGDDSGSSDKVSSSSSVTTEGTQTAAAAVDLLSHLLASSQIQLGAGDWMGLSQRLRHNQGETNRGLKQGEDQGDDDETRRYTKFGIVLASETLYTLQSAAETCLLLQRHLQRNTGRAYIATKRYYFGLGGGVDAFQQHVALFNKKNNNNSNTDNSHELMQVTTVQVHDSGAGNIRELLEVQILCAKSNN